LCTLDYWVSGGVTVCSRIPCVCNLTGVVAMEWLVISFINSWTYMSMNVFC